MRMTRRGHALPRLTRSHGRDCGASTDWYQSSPMERSMNLRVIFAGFAIATFGLFMITFNALGQQQPLKDQLVGTWTLLSWAQKKGDGTKVERYGTGPKGIAFFDAGGRHVITVMRSDRAKYASNDLSQGTPEENKETADCLITYLDKCSIRVADRIITV